MKTYLKQLRYESGKTTLLDIIKKHAAHKLVDFLLSAMFCLYTNSCEKSVCDNEETQYFCEEYFAVCCNNNYWMNAIW